MLSASEQANDTARFRLFIQRNLKRFMLMGLAGAIAAYLLTFLIPRQYRSYGVVYPPSSTAIESSIDYPNFGYDVEADRLIQILESREIRDSVVKKFDLEKYYEVDYDNPAWHDALIKEFSQDIKLERTTSMAVVISARTKDPELSSRIVQYIIDRADQFREKIYKNNIIPAYEHAVEEYNFQRGRVDSAETRLSDLLRKNKLNDLLLLMSDAQISIDLGKLDRDASGETSDAVAAEIIAFKSMYRVLEEAKARMVKIKKTLDNPIPRLFVIHPPEPLYKKVSPSFLVNALAGAVLAVAITLVVQLLSRKRENVIG